MARRPVPVTRISGINLVAMRLDGDADMDTMRNAVDRYRDRYEPAVVVLGARDGGKARIVAGVSKGVQDSVPARDLARTVAERLGGKGGGRADFAQGGGPDGEELERALESVPKWLGGAPRGNRRLTPAGFPRNTIGSFRPGSNDMSLLRDQPSFTLGVEEEYLLVDAETLELAVDPPAGFMPACQKQVTGQVVNELMRAQVETATKVCADVAEVRRELTRQRREINAVAEQFGMRIIAASTHPSALWRDQKQTPSQRLRSAAEGNAGHRPSHVDLRHARACGHRGQGPARGSDEPVPLFPAASARSQQFLAVLGG